MAIYQYVIELIPKTWIEENNTKIESLYNNDGFYDLSKPWHNYTVNGDIGLLISKILPATASWSPDIKIWGNEENNDITLSMEKNNIDSIRIRLDLRDNVETLKLAVINLAKILDCYFLIPNTKEILIPNIDLLNKSILNSNASKFLKDPEKFIDKID